MKSVIVIGDGMSDRPVERLGGRTPLQAAKKPHIDRIAREGRSGLLRTVGETGPADSAVANLAVLGYDPAASAQGRAVLEAASMGVELLPDDVAVRCNLVCLEGPRDDRRIRNHSAGHISNEEAAELVRALDAELGGGQGPAPAHFFPGVSYRHLLVLRGGWASPAVECAPPHDNVGGRVADLLPRALEEGAAPTARRLVELYERALPILAAHPVNAARRAAGKDEANAIWTWSPGRRQPLASLRERYGVRGAVISAVDLIMGLGVCVGMDLVRVPGATGLADTNYEGKAAAALDALADHDLVYVHVEATDEAGHARDLDLKIRCIEYLDGRLVRPILEGLGARGVRAAIAVLPDHPTPVATGQHGRDPVPVAILRPGEAPDGTERYDEAAAARGSLGLMTGSQFMQLMTERR
ncbi:MAG TPA: cofactor-independent phosphoglycerate mutase [Gemmatimonadales bacterium]|nr:cofactor-independent phosphoglycerate mutase [Gemmatimonadales bacterium]